MLFPKPIRGYKQTQTWQLLFMDAFWLFVEYYPIQIKLFNLLFIQTLKHNGFFCCLVCALLFRRRFLLLVFPQHHISYQMSRQELALDKNIVLD